MNTDIRRSIWYPDFAVHVEQVIGQLWPLVVVEHWERNELGERRFIDARIYSPRDTDSPALVSDDVS